MSQSSPEGIILGKGSKLVSLELSIDNQKVLTTNQKITYNEEDMINFISFVGKNYIKAKGFYYMKGDFEKSMKVSIHQILEEFKKKN